MHSYLIAILVAVAVVIATLVATLGSKQPQANGPSTASEKSDELLVLAGDLSAQADQRIAAILEVSRLESRAVESVVPVIARAAADKDELVRAAGEVAVQRVGRAAVPVLKKIMGTGYHESEDFAAACSAIRVLGTEAIELFPAVRKALDSSDAATHKFALYALENMGNRNQECIDRLIELLGSEDFNTQIGVCRILEKLGPLAAPATDKLVDVLENGPLSARSWAAIALGAIGKSEKHDITDLLSQRLDAFTQIEKIRALIGLGHIGPDARPALEKVTRLMNDPSKSCQPRAAVTRWRISGEIEPTLQILERLISTVDYKREVLELIAEMGPAATAMTEVVAQELQSEETDVQELALMALGQFGSAAESVLPQIKPLLNHPDPLLRQAAEDTIASISSPTKTDSESG